MNFWHEFVAKRREAYPHILADHQAGMGGAELAEKYGISRQRIYRILKKLSVPATPHKGNGRSFNLGRPRQQKHGKKRGQRGKGSGSGNRPA